MGAHRDLVPPSNGHLYDDDVHDLHAFWHMISYRKIMSSDTCLDLLQAGHLALCEAERGVARPCPGGPLCGDMSGSRRSFLLTDTKSQPAAVGSREACGAIRVEDTPHSAIHPALYGKARLNIYLELSASHDISCTQSPSDPNPIQPHTKIV